MASETVPAENELCLMFVPGEECPRYVEWTPALAARYTDSVFVRMAVAKAAPKVVRALREWVDWYDRLNTDAGPYDPLTLVREVTHGDRVERSRAALSGL